MVAADGGQLDVAKFLVDKRADVNARDSDGSTPLMLAASMGHLNIVKFLVANGADVNASSKNGGISLMAASFKGNLDNGQISGGEGCGC